MTVTVSPDPFTLVPYDAARIAAIVTEIAAQVEVPSGTDIHLTVDEELFAPLTGHMTDVAGNRVELWVSGANFEDTRHPRQFHEADARRDLTVMLLRAADRLGAGFDGAPTDAELTRAERAAWDVWATGRAARLGTPVRPQATRYDFRLQHGFTDAADAAFDRLWHARELTLDDLRVVCEETGAAARQPSKVPIDILRRP